MGELSMTLLWLPTLWADPWVSGGLGSNSLGASGF